MNSKKLLRNFEFSKSQDTKNSQYCSLNPKEERRGPDPSSTFLKDKDSTHTHLITRGKTAWKVNLMIYLEDTCVAIAYWTILPHLSPDKDQSSVIFSSEKINEINKYQPRTTINIEAYLIFDIRSMDLI